MNQPMPPGWYPDQRDPSLVRFWDGRQWTAQTSPAYPVAPVAVRSAHARPSLRDRWRSLRRRTKVLLVVAALVVFGALVPGEDVEPASAGGQSARVDDTDPSSDIVDAEGSTPSDGELLTEAVEEEPEEEVVEGITVPALRSTSVAQARSALLAGAVVTLVVAAPMPRVPGVLGQGAATGKAALMRAGFKVNIVKETVSSGANDVVLRQTATGRSTSLGQTPTTSTAMATEWPASPDTDEGSSSGRVPPPRVRSPLDRANCLRWWSVTDRGRPLG
jgi:hypothetical protein